MIYLKNKNKSNNAVSEIIGTMLLIGISVTLFSVIYVSLFTVEVIPASPSVNMIGTIDKNILILDHIGGEDLSLDTIVIMEFPDNSKKNIIVDDSNNYLTVEAKADDKWNIGERFTYSLDYEPGFNRYDPLKIMIVDKESNSLIMNANIKEARESDLILTAEYGPIVNDQITLYIFLNNDGPSMNQNVKVQLDIPDNFEYDSHTGDGSYEDDTAIWTIDTINKDEEKQIHITFKVSPPGDSDFTQLVFVVDGSKNCTTTHWNNIFDALSEAVLTKFPHNGNYELEIIQYGSELNTGSANPGDPFIHTAKIVLEPKRIVESNYMDISNEILLIKNLKMGGHCPMSSGIKLAKNEINQPDYNPRFKQVLIMIVAGLPDCYVHPNEPGYDAILPENDPTFFGMADASWKRNNTLVQLQMTGNQDEINCMLILNPYSAQGSDSPWLDLNNINWLARWIAWPNSDYYPPGGQWPPDKPGWVIGAQNEAQISDCINKIIDVQISSSKITGEIVDSKYIDPNSDNDSFELIIQIT